MTTPAVVSLQNVPVPKADKLLLLGLGNDILSDDAVGINIAREIRQRLDDSEGIEVQETSEMGLSLLDYIVGYDDLILVDAVQTGQFPPGFLHEFDSDDLKVLPAVSPHFFGVGEVLALGRQLGLSVPRRVKIFAVEVNDPFTVGVGLTGPLESVFSSLVARILATARARPRWSQRRP